MQLIKDRISKQDLLNVINKNKNISIRELSQHFNIGPTSVSRLLKFYKIEKYKTSPSQIEKITILKYLHSQKEKITRNSMSSYFNISKASLLKIFKKYNFTKDCFRKYEKSKKEKVKAEVIKNYNIGLSRYDIAKKLNLSKTMTNDIIRLAKIEMLRRQGHKKSNYNKTDFNNLIKKITRITL